MENEKIKEVQMEYPSADGEGFQTIELPRLNVYDDSSWTGPPVDQVKINELPNFLKDRFKGAYTSIYDTPDLAKTMDHYVGIIGDSGVMDSDSVYRFKSLVSEAHKAATKEELKNVYQRTHDFLSSIRIEKRKE